MKDQDRELLNQVFKGSQMGVVSISQVLDVVEDHEMSKKLKSQYREYDEINKKAREKLEEIGEEPEKISPIAKISSDLSVKMNTMMDKTSSHIAEMMMEGNMMGVIKAEKAIRHNPEAERDNLKLAKDLLKTEENNIQQMKDFL